MTTQARLQALLADLATRGSTPSVFNPYTDPKLLRNLRVFFEYCLESRCRMVLVGEAPGYQGCRLTGIPFTSEAVIKNSPHPFFTSSRGKLHINGSNHEQTADVVWGEMEKRSHMPILWNAFPFHPHEAGDLETNRKPTAEELREGLSYVEQVMALFEPAVVCAVGRVAEGQLNSRFGHRMSHYIRHPSRGGKGEFVGGFESACQAQCKQAQSCFHCALQLLNGH